MTSRVSNYTICSNMSLAESFFLPLGWMIHVIYSIRNDFRRLSREVPLRPKTYFETSVHWPFESWLTNFYKELLVPCDFNRFPSKNQCPRDPVHLFLVILILEHFIEYVLKKDKMINLNMEFIWRAMKLCTTPHISNNLDIIQSIWKYLMGIYVPKYIIYT